MYWFTGLLRQVKPFAICKRYHASFAIIPLGHFLTAHFRASSEKSMNMPNAIGKKKCSTGTPVEFKTFCKGGIYRKKKSTSRANIIAGNR